MNDSSIEVLCAELASCQGRTLWLADENAGPWVFSKPSHLNAFQVISNRWDIYLHFKNLQLDTDFSDFDFSAFSDEHFDNIFYRISKEKALVHHIINNAQRLLKPGGKLFLAGLKKEGIRSYIEKAQQFFAGEFQRSKRGVSTLGIITKTDNAATEPLPDQNYAQIRMLTEPAFYSKPGLYGWNKIDQGSAFLVAHMRGFFQQIGQPQSLLDLGCGYGYLTLMAHPFMPPNATLVATDNNAAALISAQQNFKHQSMDVKLIASDCGACLVEKFAAIVCNPPFHQGFSNDSRLTERFLQQAAKLLSAQGAALFVVPQFIALERKAQALFRSIEILASNQQFKLLVLS